MKTSVSVKAVVAGGPVCKVEAGTMCAGYPPTGRLTCARSRSSGYPHLRLVRHWKPALTCQYTQHLCTIQKDSQVDNLERSILCFSSVLAVAQGNGGRGLMTALAMTAATQRVWREGRTLTGLPKSAWHR